MADKHGWENFPSWRVVDVSGRVVPAYTQLARCFVFSFSLSFFFTDHLRRWFAIGKLKRSNRTVASDIHRRACCTPVTKWFDLSYLWRCMGDQRVSACVERSWWCANTSAPRPKEANQVGAFVVYRGPRRPFPCVAPLARMEDDVRASPYDLLRPFPFSTPAASAYCSLEKHSGLWKLLFTLHIWSELHSAPRSSNSSNPFGNIFHFVGRSLQAYNFPLSSENHG